MYLKTQFDHNFMLTDSDLASYLNRIGYTDTLDISFDTLSKLNFLHATTIPFENLNPILKKPVPIDIKSVVHKIVFENRGGYCFEQNTLFYHVLKKIGFDVNPLFARVIWNMPEYVITPLTHLFLKVNLDNTTFLVDVGFGAQSLSQPIPFYFDNEHQTTNETIRIIEKNSFLIMQTKLKSVWKSMYKFSLQEAFFEDFEVANWYTSTHPNHIFTNQLMMAIIAVDGRHTLNNKHYSKYDLEGNIFNSSAKTIEELKLLITQIFKIDLPDYENLDEQLEVIMMKP